MDTFRSLTMIPLARLPQAQRPPLPLLLPRQQQAPPLRRPQLRGHSLVL